MFGLGYLWSKGLRRARGAAIKNSKIGEGSVVEPGSAFIDSAMGRHSFCGYDCDIVGAEIGNFTSIANNVAIGGGRHPIEWAGMSPVFYAGRDSVKAKFSNFERIPPKRAYIGSDVWIGYRAIVMQGVTVGDGAVIGAGAIVTRDVLPYEIVAGAPARHIRYRFDEPMRSALLDSRWWDLDDAIIEQCASEIRDPAGFIRKLSTCV